MSTNRILVEAENLKEMVVFLKRVVGLRQRVYPPYRSSSVWLYRGTERLIFVVQQAANDDNEDNEHGTSVRSLPMGCDLSFEGTDYENFLREMADYDIKYSAIIAKENGSRSVIVEGPSGITIEMRLTTTGH